MGRVSCTIQAGPIHLSLLGEAGGPVRRFDVRMEAEGEQEIRDWSDVIAGRGREPGNMDSL